MHTKDEASLKLCPRTGDACVTDACMAWRGGYEETFGMNGKMWVNFSEVRNRNGYDSLRKGGGYCGAFSKPSVFIDKF